MKQPVSTRTGDIVVEVVEVVLYVVVATVFLAVEFEVKAEIAVVTVICTYRKVASSTTPRLVAQLG